MAVKKAVQSGNVEDAIEKVNDLNPEVSCFHYPYKMQRLLFWDVFNCIVFLLSNTKLK